MPKQHGALVPSDGVDDVTKGNHVLQGFADVADETARALVTVAAGDLGRVIRQTAGTNPGWYIAKVAGTGLDKWLGPLGLADLPLSTTVHTNTSFTAEVNVMNRFQSSTSPVNTFTLPLNPVDGDRCGFILWGDPGSSRAFSLAGNGKNIANWFDGSGIATTQIRHAQNFACILRFRATGDGDNRWMFETWDPAFIQQLPGGVEAGSAVSGLVGTTGSALLNLFRFTSNNTFIARPPTSSALATQLGRLLLTMGDHNTNGSTFTETEDRAANWGFSSTYNTRRYIGVNPTVNGIRLQYIDQNVGSHVGRKRIENVSATNGFWVSSEDAAAPAASDGIRTPGGVDFWVGPGEGFDVFYLGTGTPNLWLLTRTASKERLWTAAFTGVGPHVLLASVVNKYDNNAAAAMVLHLPDAGAYDGQEYEVKESANAADNVSITTPTGTTTIEPIITGAAVTTDTLNLANLYLKYKWDSGSTRWRLVARVR